MNAFNMECLINKPTCLQSENPSCIYLSKLKNYYRIKELFRHSEVIQEGAEAAVQRCP